MRPLWERLLLGTARMVLPRESREWMAGDIEEQYALVRSERGPIPALGARPGELLRMLLAGGMKLTAAGLAIGLIGAYAATRGMASMLFGVTAHDPSTFALIAILIASVAGLATYVPARRAMLIEPTRALRED